MTPLAPNCRCRVCLRAEIGVDHRWVVANLVRCALGQDRLAAVRPRQARFWPIGIGLDQARIDCESFTCSDRASDLS